jgi:CheY-like chemotaxis protein
MAGDATSPPPELPPGLLAEYLESARAQLGVLAGLAERLVAAGGDREALDALRRETHKVHGSAGSYGFMEASRLAAGMEATVKDWAARPDEPDVDRGSLARWFVKRLSDLLGVDLPDASAVPPAPVPIRSGPLPRVGPPLRPAPRPPTQRPVARPARAAAPVAPAPAERSPDAPPGVASADAVLVPEVIYVEDDAALAELLEYGLRAQGYRFLAYRNGREALRELLALDVRGTHPLLLLDVDLPALDGYSILAALERERPGTYRVVFTTVHGTEDEQLRGLEAGALDYLVKPISLRVALEKIKRWVGR